MQSASEDPLQTSFSNSIQAAPQTTEFFELEAIMCPYRRVATSHCLERNVLAAMRFLFAYKLS